MIFSLTSDPYPLIPLAVFRTYVKYRANCFARQVWKARSWVVHKLTAQDVIRILTLSRILKMAGTSVRLIVR